MLKIIDKERIERLKEETFLKHFRYYYDGINTIDEAIEFSKEEIEKDKETILYSCSITNTSADNGMSVMIRPEDNGIRIFEFAGADLEDTFLDKFYDWVKSEKVYYNKYNILCVKKKFLKELKKEQNNNIKSFTKLVMQKGNSYKTLVWFIRYIISLIKDGIIYDPYLINFDIENDFERRMFGRICVYVDKKGQISIGNDRTRSYNTFLNDLYEMIDYGEIEKI